MEVRTDTFASCFLFYLRSCFSIGFETCGRKCAGQLGLHGNAEGDRPLLSAQALES